MPEPLVVPRRVWRAWSDAHEREIDELTYTHLERRRRGEPHPVVDFLFTYYSTRVGSIRRWHPGTGLLLAGADATERSGWRYYRPSVVHGVSGLVVDREALAQRLAPRVARLRQILVGTASRPGSFACFGLHEWAMLYRANEADIRHGRVPLRLARAQIDRVVESSALRCTHVDAFRFFTPQATPRNSRPLTRAGQSGDEQPACLHAGIDLYHVASQLEAGCPGELLVDCLRAAFSARETDMRSSPYDLTAWGLDPIAVETAAGRAEFVSFQREWVGRTNVLRRRLLAAMDAVSDSTVRCAGSGAPSRTM